MDVAALNQCATVVVVDEDRVAADLIKFAIKNADVLGSGKQEGSAAINSPVRVLGCELG